MEKMYYVESQNGREKEMIAFLKKQGLITDVIESHYFFYKRKAHGELIVWYNGERFPCFAHRALEDLVRKCGERVDF